ncbi:MAG: DUF3617 family protein [Silvibacterium sp.]
MKIQYAAIASLPLLLSLASLAAAQTVKPTSPPVKMGLWREEVSTTITGIEGVTPTPHHDVEQYCISPESWKHGLQGANTNHCEVSNLHQDSHKVSYDVSCGLQQRGRTAFHMEVLIDSDEHMHGTAVAKISGPGVTHAGTWTSTLTERYIGSDCGDLKPGEKKPLK